MAKQKKNKTNLNRNNALFQEICRKGYRDIYLDYAYYMAEKHGMSFFNSAMVYMQRPGAGVVYSEGEIKKMGRILSPAALPVTILWPFTPVRFMYELKDTLDKNGRADKVAEEEIKGNPNYNPIGEHCLSLFKEIINSLGICYKEASYGEMLYGNAIWMPEKMQITSYRVGKNGFSDTHYAIVVNSCKSDIQKAKTILHEIGHILCGHLGRDENNPVTPTADRTTDSNLLTPEGKEYEAELTCHCICKMLGYAHDPQKYLAQYTKDGKEPYYSFRTVLESTEKFIKAYKWHRYGIK